MSKEPLKAGDRIAIYTRERSKGFIADIDHEGSLVLFKSDDKREIDFWIHLKACRRLVKKPRVRIWVLTAAIEEWKLAPLPEKQYLFTEFEQVVRKK